MIIQPAPKPINDPTFILIDGPDSLHPLIGETIAFLELPMENVPRRETHNDIHEIRYDQLGGTPNEILYLFECLHPFPLNTQGLSYSSRLNGSQ
jgi:hypothetical protein